MSDRAKWFWIVTVATVVWMVIMRWFTPNDIVQFEFAKTVVRAQSMITNWGEPGVAKAKMSIYLDFVFLLLYSWAINLGCKWVVATTLSSSLKKIGNFFATIIWFAASCDLIENVAMLMTLVEINDITVSIAFYFALFKFAIVIVCLLFIVISPLIVRLRR